MCTFQLTAARSGNLVESQKKMFEARDQVFCHLVARRSVARAALHLGVDAMSQEALDTIADLLIAYLERIGRALSYAVESSGRSSAHCNALDAIRAVEMCTSDAVQRVHLADSTDAEASGAPDPSQHASWKGLAAFCFGPYWHLSDEEVRKMETAEPTAGSGGGKVGPTGTEQTRKLHGWRVPYPDELPEFPVCSDGVANPHAFSAELGISLHTPVTKVDGDLSDENDVPDAVYLSKEWGHIQKHDTIVAADKKRVKIREDASDEPPSKRIRLDEDGEIRAKDTAELGDSTPILPQFYPPLPRVLDGSLRTVVDVEKEEGEKESLTSGLVPNSAPTTLRSSLVNLGKYDAYWGSGWDSASGDGHLHVPPGRSAGDRAEPSIVPLTRASGSRVSRILEGSMEPAATQ